MEGRDSQPHRQNGSADLLQKPQMSDFVRRRKIFFESEECKTFSDIRNENEKDSIISSNNGVMQVSQDKATSKETIIDMKSREETKPVCTEIKEICHNSVGKDTNPPVPEVNTGAEGCSGTTEDTSERKYSPSDNGGEQRCNREDAVSKTTGMSGGKAFDAQIIGEEYISRNNVQTVKDSYVKVHPRRPLDCSETVGLNSGEMYGGNLRGKSTKIEGNKSSIERSHVDIPGDQSAAPSFPLLPSLLPSQAGGGGGDFKLKNSNISINFGYKTGVAPRAVEKETPKTNDEVRHLEQSIDEIDSHQKADESTSALSPAAAVDGPTGGGTKSQESVEKGEIRIALIGKTGSGKSSTGNTVLGRNGFYSKTSGIAVTLKTCSRSVNYRGRNIRVIDTPGLFEPGMSTEVMKKEIMKCVLIGAPGLHAVVLVTKIGRFTKEEKETIENFKRYFGEGLVHYLIIVFTGKDDLEKNNEGRPLTLDEFLQTCPTLLRQMVLECNGRCIAVNNTGSVEEKEEFRKSLLTLIDETVLANGGGYFMNEMFADAEKKMKKLEEEIRKTQEETNRKELEEKISDLQEIYDKKIRELERKYEYDERKRNEEIAQIKKANQERKSRVIEEYENKTPPPEREVLIKNIEEDRTYLGAVGDGVTYAVKGVWNALTGWW